MERSEWAGNVKETFSLTDMKAERFVMFLKLQTVAPYNFFLF